MSASARVRGRAWTRLKLREVSSFGLIGLLAFAADMTLFTLLAPHGAMTAKFVSTVVSTTLSYVGNRYIAFAGRNGRAGTRENTAFIVVNVITFAFSEACIATAVHLFNQHHGGFVLAAVNVASIAVGTVFRYWAYSAFVFRDRSHL